MDTRIDPFSMTFSSPADLGKLLRAAGQVRPAFYDEVKDYWVMLRHRHVHDAMRDQERFSATFYEHGPVGGSFLAMDGPAHQRGRRMFTRAFAPLAVRAAEEKVVIPAARRIVAELARKDEADLVDEFCIRLPMEVLGELVGVGTTFVRDHLELVPAMIRWTVWANDPAAVAAGRQAQRQMMEKMRPVVEREIDRPGPTLIGGLVQAQREEGELDVELILLLSVGLILGGYETTAGMLAAALSALLLHPDAMARVRADRSLLMPAVEEAMRWANPGIGVPRRVLCDVDLGGGVVIPRGASALLCSVGAHYDDEVFPRPDVFDLERNPEQMLFGGGPHYCLGAPLARIEARVGLGLLLDQIADLRLDPERPPVYLCGVRGTVIHGPETLHVRYTGQSQRRAA